MNELVVGVSLKYTKGERNASFERGGIRIDVSGRKITEIEQTIGITEEALDLGDIASPGYIAIENLDADNFVELRAASGAADMIKLMPGDVALFRLATTGPYAIADTASCNVRFLLIEA